MRQIASFHFRIAKVEWAGRFGDAAMPDVADRLDLIAYAQLSSRIGGGIVLVVASVVFSFAL